jgi:ribosomal protein S18 acetylase RimI-like enzyme
MKLSEATSYTPQLGAAVNRLLPQLSTSAKPLDEGRLAAIVRSEAAHLLVAEDDGVIVGMLTLVVFAIPTGVRAWIEDVVVDETVRGRGVGAGLVKKAVEVARANDAKTIDLTSRPSREVANRLYRKMGFEQRETNVYRLKL